MNSTQILADLEVARKKRLARCMGWKELVAEVHKLLYPSLMEAAARFKEGGRVVAELSRGSVTRASSLGFSTSEFGKTFIAKESTFGSYKVRASFFAEKALARFHFVFIDEKCSTSVSYDVDEINDLELPFTCYNIAGLLRDHGFGTEDAVSALKGALDELVKAITEKVENLEGKLCGAVVPADNAILKKTLRKLVAEESKRLEERMERLLPACLKEVKKIEAKLDYLARTVAIVQKAESVFGSLNEPLLENHFKDGNFEYIRVGEKTGTCFIFSSTGKCNDDSPFFSSFVIQMNIFSTRRSDTMETAVKNTLISSLVGDTQAKYLAEDLKSVREGLMTTAKLARKKVIEKIEANGKW